MAKLNLTLEVVGRRADGYHELRSVFLRIGLADVLAVTAAGQRDNLRLTGLPCPIEGNLVLRAFELLRQRLGIDLPALRAELDKVIPVGAGLGGGSSDGAAAIELAAAAWGIGLAAGVKSELALELGSDVPFFSADVLAALVEGRGERVAPLAGIKGGAGALMALTGKALSTARVFAAYDALAPRPRTGRPSEELTEALRSGITGADLARMEIVDANDLWPAARSVAPELVERRATLQQLTGRSWLLSGSGPTLFALFASLDEARAAGEALAGRRPAELRDVMLCATDLDNPDNVWRESWPFEE